MVNSIKNKRILVTGGTGTIGKSIVNYLLNLQGIPEKIVIFSRGEHKQFEMEKYYKNHASFERLRFFIGDIRDSKRVFRATKNINIVIHTAALKHVSLAEYNPDECIKTNIIGTQNIIETCLENNVSNVISLSTDKACAPINLYGASKLAADKLMVAANNFRGNNKTIFSVVRYGNVFGSQGSVFNIFEKQVKYGEMEITHPEMTRFNITVNKAIESIMYSLKYSKGGEILIPKLESYRITDLAKAFSSNCKIKIIGIREGEKFHETMFTIDDSYKVVENSDYYILLPQKIINIGKSYLRNLGFKPLEKPTEYNSNNNKNFMAIESLRNLIAETRKVNEKTSIF